MGIYKGFRQLRCPGNSRPGAYLLHHGFHWLIFVVCAIFAGSLLLYDAYRKEQKELEQTEATEPEQEKTKNPLDDFDKL